MSPPPPENGETYRVLSHGLMAPPPVQRKEGEQPYRGLMSYGPPSGHRHMMAPNPDLPELDGAELRRMMLTVFVFVATGLGFVFWLHLYLNAVSQALYQYLRGS